MKKIAVVYWSGTGNTEMMAKAVAEGAEAAGAQAERFRASNFDCSMVERYDSFAFGCPAMGAEVLEESEFEPMFSDCVPFLKGKKLVLFGSYGWGDGEWMRSWEDNCSANGIALAAEGYICNEQPDAAALEECRALGAKLV